MGPLQCTPCLFLFCLTALALVLVGPHGRSAAQQTSFPSLKWWTSGGDEWWPRSLDLHQRVPTGRTDEQPCPQDVLAAFKALYLATDGQHWVSRGGWNTSQVACCTWQGIQCDSKGNVVGIFLPANNLTGSVPEDFISSSSRLQRTLAMIHIGRNRIKSLPENIGLLSQLSVLDVSNNSGSVNIPASLGNTSLAYLHIGNGTQHPPFEGVRLVEVPDSLADLKQLRVLDLSHNSLDGPLNPEIFNLKHLEVLDFSLGRLEVSFPGDAFRKLKNLRHFNLDYNIVVELPSNLGELSQLEFLSVMAMPGVFHGPIPDSIGQLSKLKYLSFSNNYNMQAPIPASIWNLTGLEYMDISYNMIKGTWPQTFEHHHNLTYLEMGAMMFGDLPDILGQLTSLTHFGIRTNQLTGPIPASLGNLTKLQFFNVAGNYLNGTIPDSLRSFLPNIKDYSCQMDSNDFACPIPKFVPSSCGATCT